MRCWFGRTVSISFLEPAVYGLNSDDSEIQKPKYGQVIKQRIKLLSFSAIMARTPSCAQSNRAKSCITRSKWYCNRELTSACNTRARRGDLVGWRFAEFRPQSPSGRSCPGHPARILPPTSAGSVRGSRTATAGAVQLASDYDRRSGQLPPAWSKYPNTLRDHSLQ